MTQLHCAYSVRQGRFWRGEPGELLLLRTDPLPRAAPPPRLSLRPLPLGPKAKGPAPRRWTLRPEEADEEGLLLLRLPPTLDEEGLLLLRLPPTLPRGLYRLRLLLGPRASAPRLLIVG